MKSTITIVFFFLLTTSSFSQSEDFIIKNSGDTIYGKVKYTSYSFRKGGRFKLKTDSGCATVFTGTHDKVYFHTDPEGAKVMINGVVEGITSNEVKVRRTLGKREVTLQKEGYKPRKIRMEKRFNLVTLGNLFGLVGFAVDMATGAVVKYDKVYYDVELDEN